MLKEKYINPFTDYGFKRLFGEEAHKDLLLDFLNELLREEEGEIKELRYLPKEQLGRTKYDRKAIFDLYCENERGEKFIVELQKSKQQFFKERSVYYSTFPIQQQAEQGEWNFHLKKVYMVAILDFEFEEDKEYPEQYLYRVKLTDINTCKVFYDKRMFVYIEMPKFKKELKDLENHFDRWLYVLKNLIYLERIPDGIRDKIFRKLFRVAEIAKLNREELDAYEESLKYYRDIKNVIDTARDEAREEGLREGRRVGIELGRREGIEKGIEKGIEQGIEKRNQEIFFSMFQSGMSMEMICQVTGMPIEKIKRILDKK